MAPDHWIDALPLPGTFVVNIGELLGSPATATCVRPCTGWCRRRRGRSVSIAFFLGAQLDAVVPVYPLPEALAREARGLPPTRTIRCCGSGLELPQGAAAFPTLMWHCATMPICCRRPGRWRSAKPPIDCMAGAQDEQARTVFPERPGIGLGLSLAQAAQALRVAGIHCPMRISSAR